MSLNFLITGTEVRAGKTMIGCALAFAFKVRGMRVGVMKPIATGCVETDGMLVSADSAALLASASSDLPMELVSPFRYRPASPSTDPTSAPNFDRIVEAYRKIASRSDVMIVEDSSGLATPIDSSHDFADLAIELKLEAILLVADQGGFIEAAARVSDYTTRRGVAMRGFILNALNREASANVEQAAEAVARTTGLSSLGTVRFKEPMSLAIVKQLLK